MNNEARGDFTRLESEVIPFSAVEDSGWSVNGNTNKQLSHESE